MDRTDPNTWTGSYVRGNTAECIDFIKETNLLIISYLKDGQGALAVAGLDRVINGLLVMYNAGYSELRSHIAVLSSTEGSVVLFEELSTAGNATEADRRRVATAMFKDCSDFAKSESLKQSADEIVRYLESGASFSFVKEKLGISGVQDIIYDIARVNVELSRLDDGPTAIVSLNAQPKKKNKGTIIAVLVFVVALIYIVVALFMPQGSKEAPTQIEKPVNTEISTTEETTQEIVIDYSEYVSWEYNSAISDIESKGISCEVKFEETSDYSENTVIRIDEIAENSVIIYVAQKPAIPELSRERALQLVKYEDELCFMPYYFSSKGILNENDTYTVNVGVQEIVQDVSYQSANGINTIDDLKNFLSQDFTENYISTMIFGEYTREKWVQANGKLYFEPNWGMGYYGMRESTFSLEKISEGKYKAQCASDYPGAEEETPQCNEYIIVYENGAYKMDSKRDYYEIMGY